MGRPGREDPVIKFHCSEELRDDFDSIVEKYDMDRSQLLRRAMVMMIRAEDRGQLNSIDFMEV